MEDYEIVKKCNQLARDFYSMHGYNVDEEYKFYEATHPQEKLMWLLAVHAFDIIECTDVIGALENDDES